MKIAALAVAALSLCAQVRAASMSDADARVVSLRKTARAVVAALVADKGAHGSQSCMEPWSLAKVEEGKLVLNCASQGSGGDAGRFEVPKGVIETGKLGPKDLEEILPLVNGGYFGGKAGAHERKLGGAAFAEAYGGLAKALASALKKHPGTQGCDSESLNGRLKVEKNKLVYSCTPNASGGKKQVIEVALPPGYGLAKTSEGDVVVDTLGEGAAVVKLGGDGAGKLVADALGALKR